MIESLSELNQPFIITSITATNLEEAVAMIKHAELEGAEAFEIHLPLLSFPDAETLSKLTKVTSAPMYATCRRGQFYNLLGYDVSVKLTDEQRTNALVDAVDAGINGIDFELDLFDPTEVPTAFTTEAIKNHASNPEIELAQITDNEIAVAKQKELCARVHDMGGEVILSAHTYTHIDPAEAVAIAERVTRRGGDFAKLVGVDRTMEDALETLEAHLRLNEAETVPYALMAIGEPSRIVRPIAPMFGSAWVFAQPQITPGGFHSWPTVENAREILRRVDWRGAYQVQ
jgi:3-dehydroquinate dehydratase